MVILKHSAHAHIYVQTRCNRERQGRAIKNKSIHFILPQHHHKLYIQTYTHILRTQMRFIKKKKTYVRFSRTYIPTKSSSLKVGHTTPTKSCQYFCNQSEI
ncbi:hypothetical protein AAHE18_10G253100 [Arachis hypogaea]